MTSLLKPFSALQISKRTVPNGMLTIDWSHPLANGLIGCYVPGVMGGINVASPGNGDLTRQSSAKLFNAVGIEGPAFFVPAASSGLSGVAPANWKGLSNVSHYCRCVQVGSGDPTNGFYWYGVTVDSGGSSPFDLYSLAPTNNAGVGDKYACYWGNGATPVNLADTGSTIAAQELISIGGTWSVAGTSVRLYKNGLQVASSASFASANAGSSTSTIELGYWANTSAPTSFSNAATFIACTWNRTLTADEMSWMDREPYGFLTPVEREMPALFLSIAAPLDTLGNTIFRVRMRQGY